MNAAATARDWLVFPRDSAHNTQTTVLPAKTAAACDKLQRHHLCACGAVSAPDYDSQGAGISSHPILPILPVLAVRVLRYFAILAVVHSGHADDDGDQQREVEQ